MRYPIYAAVLILVLGQSPLARAWDALAGEIFGGWTTSTTFNGSTSTGGSGSAGGTTSSGGDSGGELPGDGSDGGPELDPDG